MAYNWDQKQSQQAYVKPEELQRLRQSITVIQQELHDVKLENIKLRGEMDIQKKRDTPDEEEIKFKKWFGECKDKLAAAAFDSSKQYIDQELNKAVQNAKETEGQLNQEIQILKARCSQSEEMVVAIKALPTSNKLLEHKLNKTNKQIEKMGNSIITLQSTLANTDGKVEKLNHLDDKFKEFESKYTDFESQINSIKHDLSCLKTSFETKFDDQFNSINSKINTLLKAENEFRDSIQDFAPITMVDKVTTKLTSFTDVVNELQKQDFTSKFESQNKSFIMKIDGINLKIENIKKDLNKLKEDHVELAQVKLKEYVNAEFKDMLSKNDIQIKEANAMLTTTLNKELLQAKSYADEISGTNKEKHQHLQENVDKFRKEYEEFIEKKLPTKILEKIGDSNIMTKIELKRDIEESIGKTLTQLESQINNSQTAYNEEIKKIDCKTTERIDKIFDEIGNNANKIQQTIKIWQGQQTSATAQNVLPPSPPLGIPSVGDIAKLSIRELREKLTQNAVDCRGCNEKTELVEKCATLWKELKRKAESGEVPDSDKCVICQDNCIDCVLLECGHMTTCNECGQRIKDCPVCRMYVTRVVRTYRP